MPKVSMRAILSATMITAYFGGALSIAYASDVTVDDTVWNLVWADEFDGDALDLTKWTHEINCWGGGNNERQCYTDSEENVSVSDGLLTIQAIKKRSKGYAFPEHMRDTAERAEKTKRQPFTSGRIRTLENGDWTYGRFDIRAKLPQGQGTWPAIWMLPSDKYYGTWAASGEIDIMEAVNLGASCDICDDGIENRIHATLHYGGQWPDNENSGDYIQLPTETIDGFHTYSLVWAAGVMTWYVDGKKYARQTFEDWNTTSGLADGNILAPFDQRFHMILNFAVGGGWPEENNDKGIKRSGFPKTMQVDYVRVYECVSDPDHSLDCISLN